MGQYAPTHPTPFVGQFHSPGYFWVLKIKHIVQFVAGSYTLDAEVRALKRPLPMKG